MDRERALHELPTPYAVALRLQGAGAAHETIASALDVPVESVERLIQIGEGKLRAVLATTAEGPPGP